MLGELLVNPQCIGMEITILDPDRDPDGKIIQKFIEEVGTTMHKALMSR